LLLIKTGLKNPGGTRAGNGQAGMLVGSFQKFSSKRYLSYAKVSVIVMIGCNADMETCEWII